MAQELDQKDVKDIKCLLKFTKTVWWITLVSGFILIILAGLYLNHCKFKEYLARDYCYYPGARGAPAPAHCLSAFGAAFLSIATGFLEIIGSCLFLFCWTAEESVVFLGWFHICVFGGKIYICLLVLVASAHEQTYYMGQYEDQYFVEPNLFIIHIIFNLLYTFSMVIGGYVVFVRLRAKQKITGYVEVGVTRGPLDLEAPLVRRESKTLVVEDSFKRDVVIDDKKLKAKGIKVKASKGARKTLVSDSQSTN